MNTGEKAIKVVEAINRIVNDHSRENWQPMTDEAAAKLADGPIIVDSRDARTIALEELVEKVAEKFQLAVTADVVEFVLEEHKKQLDEDRYGQKVTFSADFGGCLLTVDIDGAHTHVGSRAKGTKGLIDSLYELLVRGHPRMTWASKKQPIGAENPVKGA